MGLMRFRFSAPFQDGGNCKKMLPKSLKVVSFHNFKFVTMTTGFGRLPLQFYFLNL